MATPIEQRYITLHPKCAQNHRVAEGIFPNGVTHDSRYLKPFPYYATHAEGAYKWDADGYRIIDYRTGHGALILGHSHPDIVAAVVDQVSKGTHLGASTGLEIRWGQWIQKLIPCAEKVRFHSSGTEATLMALRMARAYTDKTKVIKFEDHFHGWHDYAQAGAVGIGGIPKETLSTMIVLPPNDISIVEKTLREQDDVAAIIVEPTGAHMGLTPLRPSFLDELREVTSRYGVILIFDEVVTGFRISKGGAQAHYGVTPDICSLAKIMGGGLPGGAVAGKAELIDMIAFSDDPEFNPSRRVAHHGTFNANPLSAAAGCRALELVSTTPVNETADNMAELLKAGLNDLLGRMEVPGCASGVGSLFFLRLGVEHECDREVCIMSPEERLIANDATRNNQLALALYNHGVDAGTRFIMSAAHSEQDVADTVDATEKALVDMREQGLV
jgi:glutamate-1-semialdehyde 2,1-aminomutase